MVTPGSLVEGKVTAITKFGAFVLLEDGSSGMIHISEIADAYVKEVSDFLKVGQQVKVLVLPQNIKGKINLSLKQAVIKSEPSKEEAAPNSDFENMLSRFMSDSSKKMSDLKMVDVTRKRPRR